MRISISYNITVTVTVFESNLSVVLFCAPKLSSLTSPSSKCRIDSNPGTNIDNYPPSDITLCPSKRIHRQKKNPRRISILKQCDFRVKLAINPITIRWFHHRSQNLPPSIPSTFTWIHWFRQAEKQSFQTSFLRWLGQAKRSTFGTSETSS